MQFDSSQFTPAAPLADGVLIGGAAGALILVNGRIAGISGILGALFERDTHDLDCRIAFRLGLVAAPLARRLAARLPEARVAATVTSMATGMVTVHLVRRHIVLHG